MKLDRLQAVRGAAAFYLLLHHTLPPDLWLGNVNAAYLLGFAQEMQMVFLLLSGFVIHYSWSLASDRRFLTYCLQRASRLLVPLLAIVLLAWLSRVFMHGQWGMPDLGEGVWQALACVGSCYLLYYPLEMWGQDRNRTSLLIFAVAVVATLAYTQEPVGVLRLPLYFAIWWSGSWLAEIWLIRQRIGWRDVLPVMVTLGGMVLILWVAWMTDASSLLELRHAVAAWVVVVVAVLWHKLHWPGFTGLLGPLRILAPVAYTLYLGQVPLMQQAAWLAFLHDPVWEWLGYFAALLLLGWWLERRCYPAVRQWTGLRFRGAL